MDYSKLGICFVLISATLFSNPAMAEQPLVLEQQGKMIVDWKVVQEWKAKEIKKVFGSNVEITDFAARPNPPKRPGGVNPGVPPIDPWCECPIGSIANIKRQIETIKPPLSADVSTKVFGKVQN